MGEFSTDIELNFDEDSGSLNAKLLASSEEIIWTRDKILKLIDEKDFSGFYIHDDNLEQLLNDTEKQTNLGTVLLLEMLKKHELVEKDKESLPQNTADENTADENTNDEAILPFSISPDTIFNILGLGDSNYEIAERRDAIAEITLSEDEMEAFLTLHPSFGGRSANLSLISASLKEQELNFGVMKEVIESSLETIDSGRQVENILVAKGVKPAKGKDSTFTTLIDKQVSTGPTINEKGIANYRDINEFIVIEPGTELMRRQAPTEGKNGTDVFGKIVPAEAGEILPFSGEITGATQSPTDINLLISTVKGHPILFDRGVTIDPTLTLKGVNLASGNIDFDGSVLVKGDVEDGMKIKASGDVTVLGVVGKATIIAKGDVSIGQGLIGGVKSERDAGNASYGAYIESACSVTARFASCAKVNAKNTIALVEYASHCDLYAEEQVLIGQRSGKGTLIGGNTRAFRLVAVKKLGTPGSVPTQVRVGAEPDTLKKYHKITTELKVKREAIEQMNESILRVQKSLKAKGENTDDQLRIDSLNELHHQIKIEIDELATNEVNIKMLLMNSKKSRVIVNQQVYQNAEVSILNLRHVISEDSGGGTFWFEARKICFK